MLDSILSLPASDNKLLINSIFAYNLLHTVHTALEDSVRSVCEFLEGENTCILRAEQSTWPIARAD